MKKVVILFVIVISVLLFLNPGSNADVYSYKYFDGFLDAIPVDFYVKPLIQSKDTISNNEAVPILMFHNVGPWSDNSSNLSKSLTIQPKLFGEMIDYLYKNNFTPITLKELDDIWKGNTPMPQKPIVLTFDDGDQGVFQYAYPLLKEHHFHFVLFLITRYINRNTHFYMKRSEILEMLNSGLCEVGSHTRDHVNLGKRSKAIILYEVGSSTSDIKKYLSYTPTSFCYPFGGYSYTAIQVLKKFGYNMATTEIPGVANKDSNHLILRRIRIDGRDPFITFVYKVGG
ncbi:MAG: polysaccharide deacetylase family protein [Caldisericaceae bacterium]